MAQQQPPTQPQRPAPSRRPAPSERHSEGAAGLPPKLDAKGQALLSLVTNALSSFKPQVGASLDEVTVSVEREKLVDICRVLRDDARLDFDLLRCLTVVDYTDHFQVVYHLFSLSKRHKMVVKTNTANAENPAVPSVVSVWKTADWYEREGRDLFGVTFEGHPKPEPLLLWEGFEGFPGRKSFPFHEYSEY